MMWIKAQDGSLVNLENITFIRVEKRFTFQDEHALVAYGQLTSSEDYAHTYYLFEGTKEQCERALADLPVKVAWVAD